MEKLKNLSRSQLLFILLFILFGVIVPITYISAPLHVDESTFLVIGNSIKDGSLLYKDVANIKSPGVFYLSALVFSVVGKSFIAVRILTYLVHIISAFLMYRLGKKIADKNIGMIASLLFLIGVYIPQFHGYRYLTESYAVLFTLLSMFFFLKEGYRAKFITGLALGIGIIFKQTAIFLFGVFLLVYLLNLRYQTNRTKGYIVNSVKNLIFISLGTAIPLLIVFLYFFAMGAAYEMLYYTIFTSTSTFGSSLSGIMDVLIIDILSYLPIWLLSLSMVLVVGYNYLKGKTLNAKYFLLTLWLLVFSYNSFLRGSHRILFVIPPATILAALLFYDLYKNLKKKPNSLQLKCFIVSTFLIIVGISSALNIYERVSMSYWTVDDQIKSAAEVEPYIDDGKMYTFPFQNHLFFFSNLTPYTRIIGDIYSTESIDEVIRDLETNNVTYIVAIKDAMDTLESGEQTTRYTPPKYIFYDYIVDHYQPVETLEYYYIYKLKE